MSYFFALMTAVNILFILHKPEKTGNTAVFIDDDDLCGEEDIIKCLLNCGAEVFYVSRKSAGNAFKMAVKTGITDKNGSYVTGKELSMVGRKDILNIISFCRVYPLCSDINLLKTLAAEKFDVCSIDDIDVKRIKRVYFYRLAGDFCFLLQIAVMTAFIIHSVLCFQGCI